MDTQINMDLYRCQNPDGSAKDWAIAIETDAQGNLWQYVAFGKADRIVQFQAKQIGSHAEARRHLDRKRREGYISLGNFTAAASKFPGAPRTSRPPGANQTVAPGSPADPGDIESEVLLHAYGTNVSHSWVRVCQEKLQPLLEVTRVSETELVLKADGCAGNRITAVGKKLPCNVKREHGWKGVLAVMAMAKWFGLSLSADTNEVKPSDVVQGKPFLEFPGVDFREIEDAAAALQLIPKRIRLSELKITAPGIVF